MASTVCPICRDISVNREISNGLRTYFDCENCGYYEASSSVLATTLTLDARRLSPVQYAALSHHVRLMCDQMEEAPLDLTHANEGAYWEAGYAEGLGKPVLYLCKQSVFSEKGTHFDTNHCTTVMWDPTEGEKFADDLAATLRRSLGLFETS